MTDIRDRFWAKVDVRGPDDCWEWTASRRAKGYGQFNAYGRPMSASRFAAVLRLGYFDPSLSVLHKCDNPPCVNPAHLYLGTQSNNERDKVARGRHHNVQKTACPRGHDYTDDNTYTNTKGCRVCRTCKNARAREARKGEQAMNEQLAAALVAAMTEVRNPSRDAKANAGSYGYTYLTYDALSDHLRPILARHGLAWVHPVWNDDGHVMVSTTIIHASGESIEFGPLTWPALPKVQDFGGLISYLKRYSLISTFGMGAGDDDDGKAANDANPPSSQQGATPYRRGNRPQAKHLHRAGEIPERPHRLHGRRPGP